MVFIMWNWLKVKIIRPVANFILGVCTSIYNYFSSKNKKPQKQQTSPLSTVTIQESVNITHLQPDIFIKAMPLAIPDKDVTTVMSKLSRTNKHFYNMFKDELTKRAFKEFFRAVIDDDRTTVIRILKNKPELLLMDAPSNLIIESQLTWERFTGKPAVIAAKRKQIRMLEVMLPYYAKIKDVNAAKKAEEEMLSAWPIYEINQDKIKDKIKDADAIIPPSRCVDYAKSIIDIIQNEDFSNGGLSEETREAISLLFKFLYQVQKNIDKEKDYVDPEMFLYTIYYVYFKQAKFKYLAQKDTFFIRVIGLIQSILSPEMAKLLCEGVDTSFPTPSELSKLENKKIGNNAMMHKFRNGESFYRSSRDATSGSGVSTFCDIGVHRSLNTTKDPNLNWAGHVTLWWLCSLMINKDIKFQKLAKKAMSKSIKLSHDGIANHRP